MMVQEESAGHEPAKRGGTAEGKPFRPQVDERCFCLTGHFLTQAAYPQILLREQRPKE